MGEAMRYVIPRFLLLSLACAGVPATADQHNLARGVMIAHHVPALLYTSDPPGGSWCIAYAPHAIHSLAEVIDSILVAGVRPAVWYVVAAWEQEAKTWCEVDLGFGSYNPSAFDFTSAGPCFPDVGLEAPTPGWPGPNEGTAFAVLNQPWQGNWLPLYAFAGYAYGYGGLATSIHLDANPGTGAIGFRNCEPQSRFFAVGASRRGALGINMPGVTPAFPPPPYRSACCLWISECELMLEEECLAHGGVWMEEVTSCDPNPCPLAGTCCIGGVGSWMSEENCKRVGGVFHPGIP